MTLFVNTVIQCSNAPQINMRALSASQLEKVPHLIDSDHSNHQISSLTGHSTATISCLWSKHHPHTPKSSGGHPLKLSQTNIRHAVCLIKYGFESQKYGFESQSYSFEFQIYGFESQIYGF